MTTKAQDIKSSHEKKFVLKSAAMSDFKCRMMGENSGLRTMPAEVDGNAAGGILRRLSRRGRLREERRQMEAVVSQVTRSRTRVTDPNGPSVYCLPRARECFLRPRRQSHLMERTRSAGTEAHFGGSSDAVCDTSVCSHT